jgi:N-acetylmuramoyl-L-alanine amidase
MNTQHKNVLTITAVVFLHVAVITLMLAQHGCKSDGQKASPPDAATPAPAAMPAPAPTPVAADTNFVAPTRPAPETPVAPIPVAQYTEPLTSEPAPAPAPSAPPVTWVVAKGDSLTSIARKNGITVDELVAANAPNLTKTSVIHVGQNLVVPGQAGTAQPAAASPETVPTEGSLYTVQTGDSLSKIARKNGTTIAELKSLNDLKSNVVRVGQKLKLPTAGSTPSAPAASTVSSTPDTVDTSSGEYTVVAGDTLSKIAAKTGVKVSELESVNNLTDASARSLHPGQKLQLPANGHVPDASAPATPAVVTSAPTPSLFSPTPAAPSNVTGVPAATTAAPITPVQ